MPQPTNPKRLSPDDLAKQVAERLAGSDVPKRRFSLRDSVALGRLMSLGSYVFVASTFVVAGWLGVGWLLGEASPGESEVLGVTAIGAATGANASIVAGDPTGHVGLGDLLAVTSPIIVAPDGALAGAGFPYLPSPTTTTISTGASTTSTAASNMPTTTQPPAPSTSSPLPPATLPPPTTTTTQQSTTTVGPTTTTLPTSTTTAPATSTTCGNNGNGKGNCG